MARKKSSSVRREKKQMAVNIRKRVISAQKALVDTSEEVTSSKEMATAVSSVAVSIEALSEGQEKLFNALIEELSKIPETMEQKESKSEKVLEKLVDAILDLEKQLEKTTDPEQRAKIEQGISKLRGQADVAMEGTSRGRALRTGGDVASQFLGVNPRERKEAGGGVKGFLKAFMGQDEDSGLRGGVRKYFGIQPQRTVDEMLAAKRGSEDIAGTLTQAKEQKENERKAAVAARLKDVPEHFRVKSDETGRFRIGTKGTRIDEYTASGAINPRFQPASGMMGKQLVDEGSGFTYEAGKGVQTGMVPGGAGTSVPAALAAGGSVQAALAAGGGTDVATDTFKEDLMGKLDDLEEQLEDVETAADSKGLLGNIASVLGGLGGTLLTGIKGAFSGLTGLFGGGKGPNIDVPPGGALGPGAAPVATKAGGRLARFGRGASRLAKGAGRVLGKVAAPLAVGMAAYDAYKGFTADSDASLGERLRNAGSSAISGATFGLLGSSPEEIAARKAESEAAASTAPAVAAAPAVAGDFSPSGDAAMATTVRPSSRAATVTSLETSAPPAAAAAPIINNIDNSSKVNAPQAATATSGASISLRDMNNSFMRFQDRRMARVF